jgi:hypothetical protein
VPKALGHDDQLTQQHFPIIAGKDIMKALIHDIARRFGALPKGYRAIAAGVLAVLVLYNAIEIGEAAGRALSWLVP